MRTLTLLTGTSLAASALLMAGVHVLSAGTADAARPAASERVAAVTQTRPMVAIGRPWADPPARSEGVVVKAPAMTPDAVLPDVARASAIGAMTGLVFVDPPAPIKKASRRISATGARYAYLPAPIRRPSPAMDGDGLDAGAVHQQPIEFSLASR